ncbi:hypothetical protein COCNU_02G011920 [Cocos nucifera]|uniref:RRM domain-containing protein n=1 Tax=Cocos nucifera TaxID=13894 RepID=A0A8K0HZV0_COCNU|nr:hypothetical protein COCNU_02G011920 [Cocos nucifera]
MKKYFEQFGEILEAVVITDKNTGRSKGYGFSYYNVYGGAASQYPLYGGATTGLVTGSTTAFYPYFQLSQGGGAATYAHGQGFGLQYPQMLQYSAAATTAGVTGFSGQHYGGPLSLAPTPPAQAAG